jgi:serine/threonine-protein kinase
MTTSVTHFIDTLRESRLLEPARLEELLRTPDVQADGVDAPMLGQCLVQLGWLTAYQVEELLKGQVGSLLIGPYRLLERLGESEFGPAFKARHPDREGRFVIKLFAPEKLPDNLRQRFLAEVHRAGQLAHPNVARVGEIETQEGRPVYVREYVEGIDLASLVRQHGALPVGYACDYIHQSAQGLAHAHERGLVHGHVRPSNLVVNYSTSLVGAATSDSTPEAGLPPPGAVVKLVDCGLGALHHPELASPAHDLADLGQTFVFLLSGMPEGELPAQVPPAVQEIVRKLRAEAPEQGYASATELIQALAPLCGSEPALAESPPIPLLEIAPAGPALVAVEGPPVAGAPGSPVPQASPVASPPEALTAMPMASAPLASPVTAEPPVPEAPPEEAPRPAPVKPGRKKWSARDWTLVGVGLVLHLFAAGIIVILVLNYFSSSTNKGSPPRTIRQTAPRPKVGLQPKAPMGDQVSAPAVVPLP